MSTATLPPPLPDPVTTAKVGWQRALGGVWRLTYRRFLAPAQLGVLAGLVGLLALLALTSIHRGNAEHFAQWSVRFYLAFVVPVFAFLSGAGLIQDDMKPATVDYVLTRPLRRHALVIYRFLAHTACMEMQFLLPLSALVMVGVFRQVPALAATTTSLLLGQVLAVAAFSALGFAFGALTNRYLILGIFYAGTIEIGIGNIPTQLNRLSMTHHVREIASGSTEPGKITGSILSLLVFSLVSLAVSAAVFSLRETSGTKPKDT